MNSGWLPPGHPLAAGAGEIDATGSGDSPTSSTCLGTPPGSGWVCVASGWVPPDHPLATGGSGTGGTGGSSPPGGSTGGTGTPGSAACVGPAPGANWVCVNGGWVPPDHPLALGTAGSGGSPPAGTGPASCITPDPFVGIPGLVGVCVNGGWIPRSSGGTP